jgi:hypothetical protein
MQAKIGKASNCYTGGIKTKRLGKASQNLCMRGGEGGTKMGDSPLLLIYGRKKTDKREFKSFSTKILNLREFKHCLSSKRFYLKIAGARTN